MYPQNVQKRLMHWMLGGSVRKSQNKRKPCWWTWITSLEYSTVGLGVGDPNWDIRKDTFRMVTNLSRDWKQGKNCILDVRGCSKHQNMPRALHNNIRIRALVAKVVPFTTAPLSCLPRGLLRERFVLPIDLGGRWDMQIWCRYIFSKLYTNIKTIIIYQLSYIKCLVIYKTSYIKFYPNNISVWNHWCNLCIDM